MTDKDMTHRETLERGIATRRAVLGDAHVDRSMAKVSDFSRPIQELVSEYCWGEIWSGDELPRRTRSLINLAMLTALNRGHELGAHVRGALNNGVTVAEIQAVLMQTAIYVGVPAALESFRIAEKVMKEIDENG
ncbi:MAG TPA: carboxymuconolactone decarboxylase family protein [Microbacteriaceae bacterium]|nr:carboxymuconolactone decarboxylase family protein [Microbacteriaceae bacterium]